MMREKKWNVEREEEREREEDARKSGFVGCGKRQMRGKIKRKGEGRSSRERCD